MFPAVGLTQLEGAGSGYPVLGIGLMRLMSNFRLLI